MAIAGRIIKGAGKKAWTTFMDKVGSRIVERIADTSSDAPNAFHQPKRDVYKREGEPTVPKRGHDHDHDE